MRCFKLSPLILAVGLTLSPSAAPSQDEGPPSIEELTRRYREKSEVALEAMRSEVEYLLSQLADHAQTERRTSMDEVREKLVALGPEIGPLIVNSLDPGAKPKRSAQSFSTQIAMILEELSLVPVTDHLIQMAGSGSLAGKRMAIRVLGHSEDSARVSPVLKELYTEGEAPP